MILGRFAGLQYARWQGIYGAEFVRKNAEEPSTQTSCHFQGPLKPLETHRSSYAGDPDLTSCYSRYRIAKRGEHDTGRGGTLSGECCTFVPRNA